MRRRKNPRKRIKAHMYNTRNTQTAKICRFFGLYCFHRGSSKGRQILKNRENTGFFEDQKRVKTHKIRYVIHG